MQQAVGDPDPHQELERCKEFRANLLFFGVALSFVTGAFLCSFLIPGMPRGTQVTLWLGAAMVSVGAAVCMRLHVKEFGWSVPKMAAGADLC